MSLFAFDMKAVTDHVVTAPPLCNIVVEMGKHTVKLEKITSYWHQRKYNRFPPADDYVFRFSLDGKDVWEHGYRATVHLSQYGDARPFSARPRWLPDDVHLKTANNAFEKAMRTLMAYRHQ
jgi:hypothetical protein